jgi:hypothetical protein
MSTLKSVAVACQPTRQEVMAVQSARLSDRFVGAADRPHVARIDDSETGGAAVSLDKVAADDQRLHCEHDNRQVVAGGTSVVTAPPPFVHAGIPPSRRDACSRPA